MVEVGVCGREEEMEALLKVWGACCAYKEGVESCM